MGEGIPYLHTVHLLFLSCVVYAEVPVIALTLPYTMYICCCTLSLTGREQVSSHAIVPKAHNVILAYPELVLLFLSLKLVLILL